MSADDGAKQLDEGAGQLKDGAAQLDEGAGQLLDGATQAKAGVASAKDGSAQLLAGSKTLLSGQSDLYYGIVSADEGAKQLDEGAGQLKDGAAQLDSGASDLKSGATQLADGAKQLDDGISSAVDGATQLVDGSKTLLAGQSDLYFGIVTAADGINALDDGAGQLLDGTATAKDGAKQLDDGASDLLDGAHQLNDGATDLNDGLSQLYDGSKELNDGLMTARDGSKELADGLADGIAGMAGMDEQQIDARSTMMSAPVEVQNEYYTTVENYGTGFAPYFIGLALYLGTLMNSFIMKPLNNRLIASGARAPLAALCGLVPWLLVGAVQALLLCLSLQFVLDLNVNFVAEFYLFALLVVIVNNCLMQFIMATFGFPGKLIAIVLLILQLASAAGTFPLETCPEFFQVISPCLPMTYVVAGMKDIMCGVTLANVGHCCLVLAAFGVVSFALTILVARSRRNVPMTQLHPLLDL